MRLVGFVILTCLVLSTVSGVTNASAEVRTLKIVHKSFDPQTRQLEYELWNDSVRTITAWRLSLARSDAHGHAQRSVLDQDFFERQPSVEIGSKSGPIGPGASLRAQWHLEVGSDEAHPAALSLQVKAVVFDDLGWEGEPEAAAAILEARSARVVAIGAVLAELEIHHSRPGKGQAWSADLRQRAQLLRRQGNDPELDSGSRREVAAVLSATRLELARWLEDASREISLAPNPEEAMGYLKESLREQYEVGLRATGGEGLLMESDLLGKGGDR